MTPEGINFLICLGILAIFWLGVGASCAHDLGEFGTVLMIVSMVGHIAAAIYLIMQLCSAFTAS